MKMNICGISDSKLVWGSYSNTDMISNGKVSFMTISIQKLTVVNFIPFLFALENEEVKRTTLRELKVLRMLKQENIVELK